MLNAEPFNYARHDGQDVTVYAALVDAEFVFPFMEIARALMCDRPEKLQPTCDAAHVRRLSFSNLRNERKCVTLDGLFTATVPSRTDTGREPAVGPAIHFHRWLRAVVLPLLSVDAWPPSDVAKAQRLAQWHETQAASHARAAAQYREFLTY